MPKKLFKVNSHALKAVQDMLGKKSTLDSRKYRLCFWWNNEIAPLTEEAATSPLNVYGSSKVIG